MWAWTCTSGPVTFPLKHEEPGTDSQNNIETTADMLCETLSMKHPEEASSQKQKLD